MEAFLRNGLIMRLGMLGVVSCHAGYLGLGFLSCIAVPIETFGGGKIMLTECP